MDIQTEAELKVALGFLRQGNPLEAQKIISSLFEHDLESNELIYTNKCCIFWIDSIKRLKRDEEWFEFIYNNRRNNDTMPQYDLIIGPIANDTIYDTLGITTSGFDVFSARFTRCGTAMPTKEMGPAKAVTQPAMRLDIRISSTRKRLTLTPMLWA